MKLTNEHIRQIIKEEISHLFEAPGLLGKLRSAPFAGIPKDEKNPKMPSKDIEAALYPFRRPRQIAYPGLSGAPKDRDELYELSGKEFEPLSYSSQLATVFENMDSACKGNVGSGVLLYFDTPGPIPGHDMGHTVGFKKMADLQNFFKALRKFSVKNPLLSLLRKGKKDMVLDCYYSHYTEYPGIETDLKDSKITVGIRPIWNTAKQANEIAVMLNFGGPKSTQSSGAGGPYFMTQSAAAQLSKSWKNSISILEK